MVKSKQRILVSQIIILCVLSIAIAVSTIPGYLTGKWSWADLPRVPQMNQLISIRKTGLPIEGWNTITQKEVRLSSNKWSLQILEKPGKEPVTLLLLPQDYYKNHPQVEWVDLQGIEKWKIDSLQTLNLSTGKGKESQFTVRWFRAWNNQPFAVVQWYAWPGGGHYAPSQWFWADQIAQLRRQRVPWIAVSLKIPIDPLGELKDTEPLAKSLAQTVQATLEQKIFRRN